MSDGVMMAHHMAYDDAATMAPRRWPHDDGPTTMAPRRCRGLGWNRAVGPGVWECGTHHTSAKGAISSEHGSSAHEHETGHRPMNMKRVIDP